MKSIFLITSICVTLIISSFTPDSGFGSWQTSRCYTNILLRYKIENNSYHNKNGKDHYVVEVQNNYSRKLSFKLYTIGGTQSSDDGWRFTQAAGESKSYAVITVNAGSKPEIAVKEIKFDGENKYYSCDKP